MTVEWRIQYVTSEVKEMLGNAVYCDTLSFTMLSNFYMYKFYFINKMVVIVNT